MFCTVCLKSQHSPGSNLPIQNSFKSWQMYTNLTTWSSILHIRLKQWTNAWMWWGLRLFGSTRQNHLKKGSRHELYRIICMKGRKHLNVFSTVSTHFLLRNLHTNPKITLTTGKTPHFYYKMKLYIQTNVILFKMAFCFQMKLKPSVRHLIEPVEWKTDSV